MGNFEADLDFGVPVEVHGRARNTACGIPCFLAQCSESRAAPSLQAEVVPEELSAYSA